MDALHSLGIDWKLFIAQVVNFVILLAILTKVLYRPMIKLLEDRTNKIEKGLQDAENAGKNLARSEEDAEGIRQKAYKEANQILAEAKAEAEEERKSIITDAHKEAEKIVKRGAEEVISMKQNLIKETKGSISELIALSLDRITAKKIDSATRDKLTAEAIKEIE